MIIEYTCPKLWLEGLKQRYNIESTTLNSSSEGFTIMFHPNPHRTMLIARYDRERGYGVVICRRERNIPVDIDKRQ